MTILTYLPDYFLTAVDNDDCGSVLVTRGDDDDANWLISERAAAAEQTVDETRPSTSEEASKDNESSGRDDTGTDQMKDTISADTAAAAGDVAGAEQASAEDAKDYILFD